LAIASVDKQLTSKKALLGIKITRRPPLVFAFRIFAMTAFSSKQTFTTNTTTFYSKETRLILKSTVLA
jgi:hypothetical protein